MAAKFAVSVSLAWVDVDEIVTGQVGLVPVHEPPVQPVKVLPVGTSLMVIVSPGWAGQLVAEQITSGFESLMLSVPEPVPALASLTVTVNSAMSVSPAKPASEKLQSAG
jgi:hypothetical protein